MPTPTAKPVTGSRWPWIVLAALMLVPLPLCGPEWKVGALVEVLAFAILYCHRFPRRHRHHR